jgi:hypothetical protein
LSETRSTARSARRHALRLALEARSPEIRVIAQDFLTVATKTDLLAVGPAGELISVRLCGEEDGPAQPALLTRVLADLSWLQPRVSNLAELTRLGGLDPHAEPRALLVAPCFDAETLAAAESVAPGRLEFLRCREQHGPRGPEMILEPLVLNSPASGSPGPHPIPASTPPALPKPNRTGFRTGLTEADLGRPLRESPSD